ncbi:DUF805 domain-containing protein [Listeria welshimeri]|uniref:DUF805 domain-containing protein n=1 Tax=Listeria welshimeri TaxID=1643 RepID=UPI0018875B75|nr:DUF805 domain-containing protein [Listeria welshimeri]MBF2369268.1 DUF805 domain-containing protein [Listeria welshimeri]
MGFLEAYKSFWQNYFNFEGRASRSAYWYVVLWNGMIFAVLYFLSFILGISGFFGSLLGGTGLASNIAAVIVLVLLFLYMLAVIVPTISLMVRRLHDSGKSGFFFFLDFIPFVGGLIMLIFMCLESDGSNQYGDSYSQFDI